MPLNPNFLDRLLVQVAALILGIVAKITDSRILDTITLFALFYAVLVTFATALQLFLTAQVYNAQSSMDSDDGPQ